MMRALFGQCGMYEESEHAETVVDADKHHVLGAPLLSVELRFRAPSLAIAAAMNPQGHGQFLRGLSGCLCPDVQIQAVFAVGCLFAVAPLGEIAARILNGLIAGMAEGVADLHALPGHNGLWLLPTVLPDGRSGIGNATIDEHIGMVVGQYALHLTTFDC